ncbi:MAG: hypothetical protein DYG88_17010 [Chloroflexi bacterium CFX4]|nr:hypothetical protein [Chloroflexi bacterium CFX4]MDL1924207.1 hypothetical protein [Chloroflexi bacterium CFX3]
MTDRREPSTPIRQAVPQMPWRSPTQAIAIIGLIMVVAIFIGALYLAQATVTATTGSNLLELQRTREFLQRAIGDMQAQIAQQRNINTLRGRAQQLGFAPAAAQDLEYIVVEGYSPIRATPTPFLTPAPTLVYDETFEGWVRQQWDALLRQFEQWMNGGSTP